MTLVATEISNNLEYIQKLLDLKFLVLLYKQPLDFLNISYIIIQIN